MVDSVIIRECDSPEGTERGFLYQSFEISLPICAKVSFPVTSAAIWVAFYVCEKPILESCGQICLKCGHSSGMRGHFRRICGHLQLTVEHATYIRLDAYFQIRRDFEQLWCDSYNFPISFNKQKTPIYGRLNKLMK